ncbi:MAG TPA: tRNA (adenosine(37)-N6)-threonylcarbamoyltransferase complex ATPase subunit type 1 TsaE [Thermoanaerobaculia bacterium]|nr:tRNA (adenosine(37)-N6)-threonylcarbamoyltransferase complex ATPase subunit type 1 TsaE [Thermoanaerobaculia bacterium]
MRSWITHSEEETRALGAALARELAPDGVLLLSGDLGAGKTVLAQGVAAGLGIDPDEVQSPTFSLIREHRGSGENSGRLVHADLYRLAPEETGALGLEELLAGPGVKVVEWAERLPFPVPGATALRMARRPEGGREIMEQTGEFNEDS